MTIRFTNVTDEEDKIANAKDGADVHRQSPYICPRCIANATNIMMSTVGYELFA